MMVNSLSKIAALRVSRAFSDRLSTLSNINIIPCSLPNTRKSVTISPISRAVTTYVKRKGTSTIPSNVSIGIDQQIASLSTTKHINIDDIVGQEPLQEAPQALPTLDAYFNFKDSKTHRRKDTKRTSNYSGLLRQFITEQPNPQGTLVSLINELIHSIQLGGYSIVMHHLAGDLMNLLTSKKGLYLRADDEANVIDDKSRLVGRSKATLNKNAMIVEDLWKRLLDEEEYTERYRHIPMNMTSCMYFSVMKAWWAMAIVETNKEKKIAYAEKVDNHLRQFYGRYESRSFRRRPYPTSSDFNLAMDSWLRADPEYGVKRAKELLDTVYFDTDEKSYKLVPSIFSCNRMIETYIRIGQLEEANLLLNGVITAGKETKTHTLPTDDVQQKDNTIKLEPNSTSFELMIEAWARSQHSKSPSNAYSLLNAMGIFGLSTIPTANVYTMTLAALTSSKGKEVETMIYSILNKLQHSKAKVLTSLRTDARLPFESKIISDEDELTPELAEKIISEMKEDEADLQFYYSYIISYCAWSRDSLAGRVSERLLKQMEAADCKVEPHYAHYYMVLTALAKDDSDGAGQLAMEVYDRLRTKLDIEAKRPSLSCFNLALQSLLIGNTFEQDIIDVAERRIQELEIDGLKPNRITHNLLMRAWALSKIPNAPSRCQEILDAMSNEITDDSKMTSNYSPDLKSYSFLALACALTPTKDEPTRYNHLTLALNTFTKMGEGSSRIKPNSLYYNWLLMASIYLTRPGNLRDTVMNKVYKRCEKDGCLTKGITNHFKANCSEDLKAALFGKEV